jgi:hypothetical protein
MTSDSHGPNVIEINGGAMLLTTVGGGNAVHLTAAAESSDGREAVPDYYFRADDDRVPAGYDRAALLDPRWSETTLCGRQWAVMVGGDGGAIGRYGETAFAPNCRRCLTLLDRHFPKPAPDDRIVLVAQLVADVVVDRHGFAEIHGVPGDQQDQLRKAVRTLIRKRTRFAVRTHLINGIVYIECDEAYKHYADRHGRDAAEAMGAAPAGEPVPHRERDWVIQWSTWAVS